MNRLLTIIEDDNGNLSMMRVMGIIFAISFVVEWQRSVWLGSPYVPDWGTLVATLGMFGFKVIQKPFEKPKVN